MSSVIAYLDLAAQGLSARRLLSLLLCGFPFLHPTELRHQTSKPASKVAFTPAFKMSKRKEMSSRTKQKLKRLLLPFSHPPLCLSITNRRTTHFAEYLRSCIT